MRYGFNNLNAGATQQVLAAAFKTILYNVATTGATTLRRGLWDEFNFGQDGPPNATDCSVTWSIDPTTADGTGTASPATAMDGGGLATSEAAALLTYKANYTAEPTVIASKTIWATGVNQRQNGRWKVFDLAQALMVPALNLGGLVMRAKSATYASTVIASAFVTE